MVGAGGRRGLKRRGAPAHAPRNHTRPVRDPCARRLLHPGSLGKGARRRGRRDGHSWPAELRAADPTVRTI